MSSLRTTALILRHLPDREHDQQLVVLTPKLGQQRLRARGTKKSTAKLSGSLEPIVEVDLMLANGRRQDVVTGAVMLDPFAGVHQDLFALVAAQWLAELVERVARPGQSTEKLYELVRESWHSLADDRQLPPGRRWLNVCRSAWNILAMEGFAPPTDRCAQCHRPLETSEAMYQRGRGFIHAAEAAPGAKPIRQASLLFLQGRQTASDARQLFSEIHQLLEAVIHDTLDAPLRSERVLRRTMRLELSVAT